MQETADQYRQRMFNYLRGSDPLKLVPGDVMAGGAMGWFIVIMSMVNGTMGS